MSTPSERKALWFLALVALSGSTVRMWRGSRPAANAESVAALDRQLERLDSVRERPRPRASRRESKSRAGRTAAQDSDVGPPPPVLPIDIDRADSAAIESLPGIGPALAARITANRDSAGPFGSLEALCDVRGIGPSLIGKLRPLVTFTGPRRPLGDACGTASARARKRTSVRGREPP